MSIVIRECDIEYMRKSLKLAEKGRGHTSPNPMVGAVIVKDGRIIGEGWHEKYGEPHAERNALASCTESPEGSDMYVTLEPCCHHGKQPPCTDAIIAAGIKNVFVGSGDPNPLVAGKGIKILRENGINVVERVLENECTQLNEIFFHFIQTGIPFVVMKYAMTIDGKISTHTGASKWITGEAAREHVHMLRNKYSGIMVGTGTIIEDDPMLTCRIAGGKNPTRIICDSQLRTSLSSQIIQTAKEIPTVIATCVSDEKLHEVYQKRGCNIISVPKLYGHVDLRSLLKSLAGINIDSVMIEGGATLNWSALEAGIVNRLYTYISPKIFGGSEAKTPVSGIGISNPADALMLRDSKITRIGDDFLIESEVDQNVHRDS